MYHHNSCSFLLILIVVGALLSGRRGFHGFHNPGCLWLFTPWWMWGLWDDQSYYGGSGFFYPRDRKRKKKRPMLPPVKKIYADSGFTDEAIDNLIAAGKLSEARQSMKSMLQIAREMGDKQMEANYRKYGQKIMETSWKSGSSPKDKAPPVRKEPFTKPPTPPPKPPEDDGVTMEFME